MRHFALLCILLPALLIASCRSEEPAPVRSAPPLSEHDLENGTFRSDYVPAGSVTLRNGYFEDVEEHVLVQLSDLRGFGDLDGDGSEDAVVILVSNLGGTGTFHELAVILNDNGTPRHAASTLLGDRVEVRNLSVVGSEIVVDVITHGEEDPLCCPTEEVTERYRLEHGVITHVDTEESGPATLI